MTIKTTVSKRGQTAVPAEICKKYGIKSGQKIAWLDLDSVISVMPVSDDPIKAFRGTSKGLNKVLLSERKKERDKERAKR
jgi:bifunctional DNA-binding transcriptional regulator/antitoxin component of YhaV-PrlF toxin-antitoxin module